MCLRTKRATGANIKGCNGEKLEEPEEKLKAATRKTSPLSFEERIQKLKEIQQGWINYFRMASLTGKLKELDGWVRNRLRYCIWTDWKT